MKSLQFLLAQGATARLEGDAEQERIFVFTEFGIAENFARPPINQFRDLQGRNSLIDALPWDAVVEDKREVAANRLEARDFPRHRSAQRQLVEAIKIDLAEQDSFFQFPRGRLARVKLSEPAHGD